MMHPAHDYRVRHQQAAFGNHLNQESMTFRGVPRTSGTAGANLFE